MDGGSTPTHQPEVGEMEALVTSFINDPQHEVIQELADKLHLLDDEIVIDCSTLNNHCVCAANFEYFRKPEHVVQCLRKRKCFHCQRYKCMRKQHETVTASTKLILIAAALGKFEILKFLHENGCNIETKSGIYELRPLHLSIVHGHLNIFCYLLTQQVNVNATILSHGTTYSPLMLAVIHGRDDMVSYLLLAREINLAYRNSMLQTPVMFAVQNNNTDIINLLLSAEEYSTMKLPSAAGKRRRLHHPGALLEALKQDNVEVLKILLDNGCNANFVFQGYHAQTTAVVIATVRNSSNCLQLLIEHGADVHVEIDGYTAGNWAQCLDWAECINILESHGEAHTDSTETECSNHAPAIDVCKDSSEDIKELPESDMNATIHDSSQLTVGVSEDVNVCLKCQRIKSVPPVIAVWNLVQWVDVGEVLQRLAGVGHDVNRQDRLGRTSLHMAVDEQNVPGVRALLQLGACPNIRDSYMATPFWHATFWNKESMIKELIFANVVKELAAREDAYRLGLPWEHIDDCSGDIGQDVVHTIRSPLYMAVKKNFTTAVRLLLEAGYDVTREHMDDLLSISRPEIRSMLLNHISQPRSLFTIVRNYVRRRCMMSIHDLVAGTELPFRVKDCLLLREIIDLKIEPVFVHI